MQETKTIIKRKITFKDKENNKATIEIELKDGKFSASGEYAGSCGQCLDSIKPRTEAQKKLIQLWEDWHLNDCNAGTEKQTELLKKMPKEAKKEFYTSECDFLDSYDNNLKPIPSHELKTINNNRERLTKEIKEVEKEIKTIEEETKKQTQNFNNRFIVRELKIKEYFDNIQKMKNGIKFKIIKPRLQKIDELKGMLEDEQFKTMLYDVHPKTEKPYKYGSEWLKRELPQNFEEELNKVLDTITEEERQRKTTAEAKNTLKWDDITDEKIKVLGQYLEMTPQEAEDEIINSYGIVYEAEGLYYYVGDEDEIQTEAEEYLKSDTYIYEEWVKQELKNGNGSTIKNLDDWASWVIEVDGYGHILNSWDGSEDYDNESELYIIRQG
jgi:translation initiation factor 2B subunit (eIF-2B alpha/beta/delta family)